MQFLTPEQAGAWARQHGYSFTMHGASARLDRTTFQTHRFGIPEDAGRRVALARLLWEATIPGHAGALLWPTEWGVWQSGEHEPLVMTLRRAHGETRRLIDAPALRFDASDQEDAFSFLVAYVLFLWDCYVLVPSGESGFFLSHDEFGRVFGRSPDASIALTRRLEAFGLDVSLEPAD